MTRRLGDIDVALHEQGAGPPVVLVHGLAEDRRAWRGIQDSLPDFHTVAYDLRGHGQTSAGEAAGTLAQLGEDLIGVLEAVTGPAACVGYSLGGTIVLWTAATRPDLVTRAVVSGTSTVVGRTAAGFFADRIALIETDKDAFATALRDDTQKQLVTDGKDLDAVTAWRLEAVGVGAGYVNAARAMAAMHGEPLTPLLGRIRCPVDIIGGEHDAFCPRKAADIMCAALADAAYHEIPNCGHLMSVDQPEGYAAAIRAALTRRN